ncbi:hypothetical protein PALB_11770 [Pseudoalteromonas luteoviolacea B = ATCC 29581]|nr:hypothetical protein PALB_11770 [Pseudoalteromonas luteoviolacea B = ATCC 29581]
MFKKSLLAVALSATAFGAAASTIDVVNVTTAEANATTAAVVSQYATGGKARAAVAGKEGLALAGDALTLEGVSDASGSNVAIRFAPGAGYPNGSAVTFEITGAEFDTTGATPSLEVVEDSGTFANADDMQFLSRSATKLVFQVKDDEAENAQKFLLNTKLVKITGDVKVTAYASTPVVSEIDKTSATVLTLKTQIGSKATATTGVVDVSKDRKQFVDASKSAFEVAITDATADIDTLKVTAKKVEVKLNNDLSGFDTDGKGTFDDGVAIVATDTDTTFAYDKDKKTSTISRTNAAAFSDTYGLKFTPTSTNKIVLSNTSFSGALTATYTDGTKDGEYKADVAYGSWSLNGSQVEIPYMPFGDNTAVVLRITNTSSKTGDLTVRYMLEDGQNTWKSVGVVGSIGPGVTDIGAKVLNAVKADAGVTSGKVALDLTTNVPGDNVDLTALFKVVSEQDRAVMKANRKDK